MSEEDWRCSHGVGRDGCLICKREDERIRRENDEIRKSFWSKPVSEQLREYDETVTILEKQREMSESSVTVRANTDKEDFSLTQIPLESLKRVGKVFKEGEEKYGKGNWLNGVNDKDFQIERANHAVKHLFEYMNELDKGVKEIELSEDSLAKVAWFCLIQMELERIERIQK